MPPTVAFQQYTPGQPNLMPPPPQLRAVLVVQVPHRKTAQESRQTGSNHPPHLPQDLAIPVVFALLLCGISADLALRIPLFAALAVVRANADFHDVHGAQQHNGCQDGVCVLVERGVLQVVVVCRDENRQARERGSKYKRKRLLALMLKGRPEHKTSGVNHRQLVDQLHRVLERGVEEERAGSDDQVADEG